MPDNSNDTPGQLAEYTAAPCRHFRYADGDPRITRLGLGVPALEYAELGCHIAPARRGAKRPDAMLGTSGGIHHATGDPRQITAWWRQDKLANIMVRTGQLPSPGRQVVVADLDVKHDTDGRAIFAAFLAGNGLSLPEGLPVARTWSGGQHLWMGWPREWGPCPERQGLLPGVDIKGDSNYVLAPPSHVLVMPDGRDGNLVYPIPIPYMWESGCPCRLPWAPEWFAHWITTAAATGRPRQQGAAAGPGGDVDAEQVMANGAEAGRRNTTYYKLACSRYRKHGTDLQGAAEVLAEVRQAWLAGDTAGMPWREVTTAIASARRFIEKQEAIERRALIMWMGRR